MIIEDFNRNLQLEGAEETDPTTSSMILTLNIEESVFNPIWVVKVVTMDTSPTIVTRMRDAMTTSVEEVLQ